MDVGDVEMDEDDMDMVSNEPNSTAVENDSFQLLTPSSSSDDETATFQRGGMSRQPSTPRQLMAPSDSSDDVAANGRRADIAAFSTVGEKFKLMSIMSTVVEKGSDSMTFVVHHGGNYLLINNGELSMLSYLINVSLYLLVNNKTPLYICIYLSIIKHFVSNSGLNVDLRLLCSFFLGI